MGRSTPSHELSRADARRIAVRAQLLTRERPTDILDTVRHLTVVQHDTTEHVAPSHDLVLWSRLGSSYQPQRLRDLVDEQRLVDLYGMLRPAEDIALHRAEMAAWPAVGKLKDWQVYCRDWVKANNACRQDILQRLLEDGPLPTAELPDTCTVPWQSSGWNDNRNRRKMIDFLVQRGEVAVAGGTPGARLWDLAERVYPDVPPVPYDEAQRELDRRRLASLGLARGRPKRFVDDPQNVGEAGEPAVVEGTRGTWRVEPSLLGQPFAGRAAVLSPLDRLVVDRKRLHEIFDFDYQLEMYKPARQRLWGYWAMPILHGDQLVGKLDAQADRAERVLRVDAVHRDVPWDDETTAAVEAEIASLAEWLGLELDRADS
jgi:uncharacterized protein YcaQ